MNEPLLWTGVAVVVALAFGWEHQWKKWDAKRAAKKERVASCPHNAIYYTSLWDQQRPTEWTRHCASCGYQTPWMDGRPPRGALVKTKTGSFHYKPHD